MDAFYKSCSMNTTLAMQQGSTKIHLATWSHKNTYHFSLSVRHRFTYPTARFTTVSKRNVHWVALKHRLNTWTLARFYYLDIGTYCCIFITLLQKLIAAVQNSNIRSLSLKCNALSCPITNSNLNLPDSVNKCKTYIKTYLLIQPCHFNVLVCRFELLYRTVITQESNWSSSPFKYISVLRELQNKLTVCENTSIWSWICVMLTFKSISFQISQHINIVLKS